MTKTNNKELAARFLAVQACYEMFQTGKSLRVSMNEYLDRGLQMDDGEEGIETTEPSRTLFKKILSSLHERLSDVEDVFQGHMAQKANADKETEPLLKAILFCGICEILAHQDIDAPLIMDDYLNVTHGFYEKGQVSLVNGVLDTLSKNLRT